MYNNTCGILEPTEQPTIPTEAPTTTIDEKVIGECHVMQVLKRSYQFNYSCKIQFFFS